MSPKHIYQENNKTIKAVAGELDQLDNSFIVVGDEYYINTIKGSIPFWAKELAEELALLGGSLVFADLENLHLSILNVVDGIKSAKNAYTDSIYFLGSLDEVIMSRLETLNSSVQGSSADIKNLEFFRVTEKEAYALSVQQLSADINDGRIKSIISSQRLAISNATEAIASNYFRMQTAFEHTRASITQMDTAFASYENAFAGTQLSLESDLRIIGQQIQQITTVYGAEVEATESYIRSAFKYNSEIRIGNRSYKSGFGLNTSYNLNGSGLEIDPYVSEFWIEAQRFRIVAPSADPQSGSFDYNKSVASPFEIKAINGVPVLQMSDSVLTGGYNGPLSGNVPVGTNGFRVSSNASGTERDPHIYGGFVRGSTVFGSEISGGTLLLPDGNYIHANGDFLLGDIKNDKWLSYGYSEIYKKKVLQLSGFISKGYQAHVGTTNKLIETTAKATGMVWGHEENYSVEIFSEYVPGDFMQLQMRKTGRKYTVKELRNSGNIPSFNDSKYDIVFSPYDPRKDFEIIGFAGLFMPIVELNALKGIKVFRSGTVKIKAYHEKGRIHSMDSKQSLLFAVGIQKVGASKGNIVAAKYLNRPKFYEIKYTNYGSSNVKATVGSSFTPNLPSIVTSTNSDSPEFIIDVEAHDTIHLFVTFAAIGHFGAGIPDSSAHHMTTLGLGSAPAGDQAVRSFSASFNLDSFALFAEKDDTSINLPSSKFTVP